MRVILGGFALDANGVNRLRKQIAGERSNHAAEALIAHVRDLGAAYVVVEKPYTDQDYSADYASFYAGAFKDHPRTTVRVHFFKQDISGLLKPPFDAQQAAFNKAAGYLGFMVIRPIAQGPIGRTVLPFPAFGDGLTARPSARADFDAHLLGIELEAKCCAPFIQQDTRVGACAQAAIWMASRTVFARHKRTAWHSVAEITKLAATPSDAQLSQALPAGSAGLNPAHIIRALSGMGHQPPVDYFGSEAEAGGAQTPDASDVAPSVTPEPAASETQVSDAAAEAAAPPPAAAEPPATAAPGAVRYLDSGLPVVLGLGDVSHAVTAVGYVEVAGAACRPGDSYDAFVRALIVHDDQRGPYRLLPIDEADAAVLPEARLMRDGKGGLLTVTKSVSHMFVPLPMRVYLSANDAEEVARDYLANAADFLWPLLMDRVSTQLGQAAAGEVQEFMELVRTGRLVRRTYLTSAARYRHHLAHSGLVAEATQEALLRTLPHFVWVTELMRPTSAQMGQDGPREILGHTIINATSSTDSDLDLLLVHAPHLLLHRDINPEADSGVDFEEELLLLGEDHPYRGRLRR